MSFFLTKYIWFVFFFNLFLILVVVVGIWACKGLCYFFLFVDSVFGFVLKQHMHIACTRCSFIRNVCFA